MPIQKSFEFIRPIPHIGRHICFEAKAMPTFLLLLINTRHLHGLATFSAKAKATPRLADERGLTVR